MQPKECLTKGKDFRKYEEEGAGIHLLYGDPAALPLCEAGEHGIEVGRAGSQHHLNRPINPVTIALKYLCMISAIALMAV